MAGKPLVAVVGPTASGKSELGLDIAEALGSGIILNVDSMQLYQGLDIGTAKTPEAERRGIPHVLFDELRVDQEASVARYQTVARAAVKNARAADHSILPVGGSGLYVRALLDEFEFPGTDPFIRTTLEEQCNQLGSPALHAMLRERDPQAAEVIHPNNGRRIVRALEVIEITGQPFSASLPRGEYVFDPVIQVALRWELDELDRRINERTSTMFANGILEETQAILDGGLTFGKTAARATGYAQALAVLDGSLTVSQAVEQVSLATRQLARRQIKWFRRDQRIVWLDPHRDPLGKSLQEVAAHTG